ncbi:hypothetical protein [Dactylosporangium sp. CA-139066]|uniref:hypothetical protein n=1 Tax=Dactylosporangium sp. CA-139066 TaxID=3239930 RepID=UPI003D8E32D5
MTLQEIALPEWPLGGVDPARMRAAVDRWVRSEAMAELVRAFHGTPPHGTPEEALAQLVAFSDVWDYRKGGLERSDVVAVDYPDHIDDLVHDAARALGLAGRNRPSAARYDHLLVLGGGPRTALARSDFAAHLVRGGIEAGSVAGISSLRPIGPTEVEFAAAEDMPDREVEADVMAAALVRAFGVEAVRERRTGQSPAGEPWRVDTYGPLTVLAAASNTPGRRANTQDGFIGWGAMVGGPAPTERILVVTTDLYVPFQHAAAVLLLGMRYGCAVETVGLDILDYGRWLKPSTQTAILQELRAGILGLASLVAQDGA